MPKIPPESMQHHLRERLNRHGHQRWPHVEAISVRFRAGFAYVTAELPGGQSIPLCRLRFIGVLHTWSFALYLASSDTYKDNILPSGLPARSPEEALDCAGAFTSVDRPHDQHPSTNFRGAALVRSSGT